MNLSADPRNECNKGRVLDIQLISRLWGLGRARKVRARQVGIDGPAVGQHLASPAGRANALPRGRAFRRIRAMSPNATSPCVIAVCDI